MRNSVRWMIGLWIAAVSLLPIVGAAEAQDVAADGTIDLTQASSQKSIIFFRTFVSPNSARWLDPPQVQAIESSIRGQVEGMGRFDVVRGIEVATESLEGFITQFQTFLKDHTEDIARIRVADKGVNYDFEYQDYTLTVDVMAQVLNSGYAYLITIGDLRFEIREEQYTVDVSVIEAAVQLDTQPGFELPAKLRWIPAEINPLNQNVIRPAQLAFSNYVPMRENERREWRQLDRDNAEWKKAIDELFDATKNARPQPRRQQRWGKYYVAQIPISVSFFGIRVVDDQGNLIPPAQAVRPVKGGRLDFAPEARQTTEFYLLEVDNDEWKELYERSNGDVQRLDKLKAERETIAQNTAVDAVAQMYPTGISTTLRQIDEFKIRDSITETLNGTVTMRSGRKEDVRVDDWYRLYAPSSENTRIDMGWVKVRKLGPGNVAASAGTSQADVERTELQVISGEGEIGLMLEEYATFGIQIDLSGGWEFLQGYSESDLYAGTDAGRDNQIPANTGFFAVSLFVGWDLGRAIEVPEFWVGLDATLGVGSNLLVVEPGLLFKKKFYFGSMALDIGVGFGISFYSATATEFRDIAFHIFKNVGPVNGTALSPAQAAAITDNGTLSSDVFFWGKIQPRFSIFFSPHFELFVQVQFRVGTSSSTVSVGGRKLDGDDFPTINGFDWKTLGFGADLGLSLFF